MKILLLTLAVWAADSNIKLGKDMVTEAQSLIKAGVKVIDVRQEACEGYVKGANLISVDDIVNKTPAAVKKLEELSKGNKAAKFATYCRVGGRAEKAAKVMRELGYTNVVNIGGLETYFDPQTMVKCSK